MTQSNLSYEEYAAWVMSRKLARVTAARKDSCNIMTDTTCTIMTPTAATVPVAGSAELEECPVTIRSTGDHVQVTPSSRRSK